MGILSEKSGMSYKAAILLLSKEDYCNSIQCSYFSCLQLAKDNVLTKSAKPELIERELKSSNTSHIEIIKKAGEYINWSLREKGMMLEIMTRMKRWRKNAIYDNVRFSEADASQALQNCSTVNHILNKS